MPLVAMLCSVVGAGAASGRPANLKVGQGFAISKTGMVCVFAGPANQIGLACLYGPTVKSAYSFRLDETRLLVFRRTPSGTVQVGAWTEPKGAVAQGHSAAVSNVSFAGQVSSGSQFGAAGTDLGCGVYTVKGTVSVACFKRAGKGVLNGSYAVALGRSSVEVSRFRDGKGTTVYVGSPVS